MMEGSLQKQLDETEILEEMPFTEWLKMFSTNHSAVFGLVILIFVISLSLIGPLFYKTDPFEIVVKKKKGRKRKKNFSATVTEKRRGKMNISSTRNEN